MVSVQNGLPVVCSANQGVEKGQDENNESNCIRRRRHII